MEYTQEKSQLKILWTRISERLEKVINPVSFDAFIRDLEPLEIVNRHLILRTGTDLAANTIMGSHSQKIKEEILRCDGGYGLVGFRLVVNGSSIYNLDTLQEEDDLYQSAPINKSFTFDSFVPGAGSKLVYEAAKTVAENPGAIFNPLFIYGESGLGKTHLMHAIANHIAKHSPEKKVLYTTCNNFLNEFIDSLSQKNNARFRMRYRNVDVLMIDDIQFLKNKQSTQEEFFHTFNELYAQNKQIVITSDKHPKEIATLEERLRTRFAGGMIADIQPPELETKIAILKRKALDRKCHVPDEVLEFLANNSGHDVRTLEGRLTKVIFASKLHEEPITIALAKMALHESVSETTEKEELTPDVIINAVCNYFKQKRDDLIGKGKKAEIVKARQICAYLMCEMLTLPLVSIGSILGGRDHTTIMYARDKVADLIKLNEHIAKEVDDIKSILLKQ